MSAELCWMSAADLARAIASKKVSPLEVVDAVLARIDKLSTLNAYVTLDAERARGAAKAAERALTRRSARLGPLHGVPFSVKDLVLTKGVRTTFGTPIYRDNVPTTDAPIVERLKAAGGIMIGKTNTPTLGWVGITDNLVFGVTRNPWNVDRTPGGSSGGAGAAVAAGLAPLAVGTDGGGSIRKPAAFCGIFGHKPTYGRIPIHPHGASWSFSHLGPMTRTVRDAALMMNACAGPDPRDQYSLPADGVDHVKALRGSLEGLRVAYSDTLGFAPAVDPEVRAATRAAAGEFRKLGCRVRAVDPGWPSPYACWRTIFLGGIAARLAPYRDPSAGDRRGATAHHRGSPAAAAHRVRGGLVRAECLGRAHAAILREPRSASHADRRHRGLRAGDPLSRHDRWPTGVPRGVQRVHVPVQHDRRARGLRALRFHARRDAHRSADRRPSLRGCDGAPRLRRLRGRTPVGGQAPGGLNLRSGQRWTSATS